MSVEKGLYAAPEGMEEEASPDLEIEIVDPEMVTLDDGSVEITVIPGEELGDAPFDANLAEYVDQGVLAELSGDLVYAYENDLASRKDWEETYTEGIKLLGLKYEERTEPWAGACGVHHPMIAEAAVRFQAEAIMETFPASGPVRTKIIGEVTPAKNQAADRVRTDMNYQLTEVMKEYRAEHEKMLWNLPIAGSAFKKVYYDPTIGRQISLFVPAEDVILPYGISDISHCERITHRMRKTKNELLKLQESKFYRDDVDINEAASIQNDPIQNAKDRETGFSATFDDRHQLLEMHVELDLPGFEDLDSSGEPTGIPLPYVVTILKDTGDVLSIRRNYDEVPTPTEGNLEAKVQYKSPNQYFVHYQYVPGFGSYGFGLVHLIGNSAKSATAITRQLVDAGTLSNLPGGLKTRGLRIKGDDTPINPGEFRDVDVSSGALRDNIMPLPYKEPSQALLALLGIISEEARRFAASPDMKVSDMSAQAPVGTTLALIERNLKVMSAVQARMHYSMKQELKLLAVMIRDHASTSYDYTPVDGDVRARQEDYSYVEIIPVSDPNASTLAQRVVQYQAVIQLAQMSPEIYNLPKLHRQMLEVLSIKDAAELVPLDEDQEPTDPISENMNILNGKPVKAFMYQDHEAHIQVHMAAMQDPVLMEMMGQNPKAQMMMQAAQAHITEHIAFAYRDKIQRQMGVALPPIDADMPEEIETQLSRLAAEAAGQLLQKHTSEAQAKKTEQMQQDPVIQMQQAELQIKQKEVEIKEKQMQIDAAAQADKMALEREKLQADMEKEGLRVGAKTATDRAKLESQQQMELIKAGMDAEELQAKQETEGLKAGIDIAKAKAQMEVQQLSQMQPKNEGGEGFKEGGSVQKNNAFDPDGSDYDYETATKAGMGPTGTGENEGHWGSVAPASKEDRERYNLPQGTYVLLKGNQHPTWDKAVKAEESRGSQVKKIGNRYYSIPKAENQSAGRLTGDRTTAGRPVYKTNEGANVSELSVTVPMGDKWVNVPTIHNGKQYTEEEVVNMLNSGKISPTSVHESVEEAVAAAKKRSSGLLGEDK